MIQLEHQQALALLGDVLLGHILSERKNRVHSSLGVKPHRVVPLAPDDLAALGVVAIQAQVSGLLPFVQTLDDAVHGIGALR